MIRQSDRSQLLCILIVVAATVGAAPRAAAQSSDCVPCEESYGWDLDIVLAPAYVSDDAFRFGNQTGLDESGGSFFGDFNGRYTRGDATFFEFEGYARGADANGFFAKGGKQGVYTVTGFFQSVPQRAFGTTVSPFSGAGTGQVSLPASWVRGANTSLMTDLANSAAPATIGLDWTNLGIGVDLDMARNWDFNIDYVRREKDGVRRSAASFLFSGLEFLAPVDYVSDNVTLSVGFTGASWEAGFKYRGSLFSNGNEALTWDNPYQAINNDDQGRNAQPPDNESHRFSLSGALHLPARTMVSGLMAVGRLEQDERLLPYTINPTLVTDPLPTTNGKATTTNVILRAVSSPLRRLSLDAEFRYNDFDNETPINEFRPVITDVGFAPDSFFSNAFDYERSEFKLSGNYRVQRSMRFYAGYDTRTIKRTGQERRDTDTDRLWARFRGRIGKAAELDIKVFSEERDGSTYGFLDGQQALQNPLMRKYNMADRDRDGWRMRLSLLAVERLDLGVTAEEADDDYKNSTIGLTASDYSRVGANASWSFGARASVYASVDRETIENRQANSQSFSLPDWSATTDDEIRSGTFGAHVPGLFGAVDASLAYTWLDAKGSTRNNTSGLRTVFPDTRSDRRTLSIGLEYPYSEKLTIGVEYFLEELETDDWALDGVEPDTVSNLLGLGAKAWNYDQSVVYVSVRYRHNAN